MTSSATGGNGGGGSGNTTGKNGGNGTASATLDGSDSTNIQVTANAAGGSGGHVSQSTFDFLGPFSGAGGSGGDATANATSEAEDGNATASATANGGNGGGVYRGTAGIGGDAHAEATAITETGTASASASANAGDGGYVYTSNTYALGGTASASATATAGGVTVHKFDAATDGGTASASVSITAGASSITVPTVLSGLTIDRSTSYSVTTASGSTITFQNPTDSVEVTVASGSHTLSKTPVFNADAILGIASSSQLSLGSLDLTIQQGRTITKKDQGALSLGVIYLGVNVPSSSLNSHFQHDAGSVTANALLMGFTSTSGVETTYTLDGGTLNTGTTNVGYVGNGIARFEHNAGAHHANTLYIYDGGDDGFYELNAGSLETTQTSIGTFPAWGHGSFVQNGGSHQAATIFVGHNNTDPWADSTASYDLTDGTLTAQTLSIGISGTFDYEGGTLTADVANSGTFNVRGGGTRIVDGDFTNNTGATIKTWDTALSVTGTFTNNGSYVSDPADNFFGDLVVGESGALVGGEHDRFFVSGDLRSTSANATGWDTDVAQLLFDGDAEHVLSVTGADLGATYAGFVDNFAWGVLSLALGESLNLVDGNAAEGGALYVRRLLLEDGLDQLGLLSAAGVNVYYDPGQNAFLGGQTFDLAGGGSLSPVPEPAMFALVSAGLVLLARPRADRRCA